MERNRIILASLVSPLVGPVVLLMIIYFVGLDLGKLDFTNSISKTIEFLELAFMFFVLGIPVVYFFTLVFGLPALFITHKLNKINFFTVTIGSSIISIIPILYAYLVNGSLYSDPDKSGFGVFLSLGICGFIVGIFFWFISGLRKYNT